MNHKTKANETDAKHDALNAAIEVMSWLRDDPLLAKTPIQTSRLESAIDKCKTALGKPSKGNVISTIDEVEQ